MDHLASAAELRQGGKDWYVGWWGIPINNCPREKCEHVTAVLKSGNLSVWKWICMYLDSLLLWVKYWNAGNATRLYVTLYSISRRLSMSLCLCLFGPGNANLGPSTWQ